MKKKIIDQELKESIGKIIQNLRKGLGMEQIELAHNVGYSHASTISQIESGKQNLYMDDLVKIARALGVSVTTILQLAIEKENLTVKKLTQIQKLTRYIKENGKHVKSIMDIIDSEMTPQ